MSNLYCIVHHYPTESFVVDVRTTEEEAIEYCNFFYDVKDKGKLWTKFGASIFIDEVVFNGLVNDQALS